MVGYINTVRDREYKLCTPEQFDNLVNSPMVSTHIEECRKGNAASKSLLPAFLFQGYDPNVLLGKKGSRLAKALKPTGFFIMDFDHISGAEMKNEEVKNEKSGLTPHSLYDRFLQKLPSLGFDLKRDVALAHITPSGDGLRLVLVTPKGMTIEAAQEWVAKIMEIECDAVVKDLSRLSFCPMASDILYINKSLLFSSTNNNGSTNCTNFTNGASELGSGLRDENKTQGDVASDGENSCNSRNSLTEKENQLTGENPVNSVNPVTFPETYNGIPYKRIVEELILLHGGEPQVGNRENTIFRLASDLAKITDRSAPWLESLIPTFGLPETEWRNTIAQVCKKPMETGMSRLLQQAVKRCEQMQQEEEAATDKAEAESLPPAMPKRLPRLIEHLVSNVPEHLKPAVAQMCFPALAAHVSNAAFVMLDNTEEELGLAACLFAKQSGGKSQVNKPIRYIMRDIDNSDNVQRERLRLWAEQRKNKKANEKGTPKPRVAIRWLDEDITSAAFLERLGAAEQNEEGVQNYCCYTHTNEIEKLYNFNTGGGKAMIRQTIKSAFDRDRVGSTRVTAEAINEKTHLRWNWTACSTIENGKDFFSGKMITDGAVSRVDFCTIIPPKGDPEYVIGKYDKEWRDALVPYIDNLNRFKCATDEDGEIQALLIPQARELERRLNELTNERNAEMPDEVYKDYGRRCRTMTVKKIITLYIANGGVWEDTFDEFALWMFDYSMWCKLAFFYETASEKFGSEVVRYRGHKCPLKEMPREFTFGDFVVMCKKYGTKKSPAQTLAKYKFHGHVRQVGDKYVISDEYCRKFGIK